MKQYTLTAICTDFGRNKLVEHMCPSGNTTECDKNEPLLKYAEAFVCASQLAGRYSASLDTCVMRAYNWTYGIINNI